MTPHRKQQYVDVLEAVQGTPRPSRALHEVLGVSAPRGGTVLRWLRNEGLIKRVKPPTALKKGHAPISLETHWYKITNAGRQALEAWRAP